MKTSAVTLDFSRAIPLVSSTIEQKARALQSAVFYAVNQDPENAAVSGVDEIQRLGEIEQHAAVMRAAVERAAAMRSGAGASGGTSASYDVTATNPDTQHQIGTNDGGRSWFDVQTGERV